MRFISQFRRRTKQSSNLDQIDIFFIAVVVVKLEKINIKKLL